MRTKEDRVLFHKIIYLLFLCIYAGLLFYLFYSELTVYPTDPDFRFESDTYVHVRFAVEDRYFYSLSSFIYLLLSFLPAPNVFTALFLTLAAIASVPLTGVLMGKILGEELPCWLRDVLSFALNLVMAFYLPFVNKQHYIGYQNANMWHNSTYILMKTAAIVTVILFVKVYRARKESIKASDWLWYTLMLTVSTAFKASFFTVFAPSLALVLLYDLMRKETSFKNTVILALSVVPSFAVMILESLVLFSSDDTHIVIAPFKTFFERGDHPKVSLITSVLFVLVVILITAKVLFKDRYYVMGLLLFAVGFTETMLLSEEGARGLDSNFMWGYSIALFFVFMTSALKLWQYFKNKTVSLIPAAAASLVFLWHLLSGLWYFVLLLQGFTYFA